MSRHLSGVTLARIESRRENIDNTDTDTLVCLNDVYGHLRCVEYLTFKNHRTFWAGENDGRMVIRDYSTSKPIYSIERKTCNVFVDCLQYAGEGTIWAGMTDGTIRIFEVKNARLVDEFKAHSSGVTAMTVSNMKSDNIELEHHMDVIITCSADWSIAKWDARTVQCLGRLHGHTNSVRCLYATNNGDFLLSGGDDGVTRLWCLSTNMEVNKTTTERCGWPLYSHDGKSVTGIVGVESSSYFVSIGADGSAQAHEINLSGAWIGEVERRPVSLSSIFYDAIHKRIWIGGVDGFISLFDEKLPEMNLITTLHDHSGAYVSCIKSFGSHISHEVLTLDKEGVLCKYTESNTQFHGNYLSLTSKEDNNRDVCEDLQTEIDDLRGMVVKNYNDIQAFRKELITNELHLNSVISGVSFNLPVKAKYLFLALKYVRIKEVPQRLKRCATLFSDINVSMNRRKWYLRWLLINSTLAKKHAELVFSKSMTNAANSLSVQQSFAESINLGHKQHIFITWLSHSSKALSLQLMMRYYRTWHMYHCVVYKENHLKEITLNVLVRTSCHALMHKYWKALLANRIRESHRNAMVSFLLTNLKEKSKGIFTVYYKKWERYYLGRNVSDSYGHDLMKFSKNSNIICIKFNFTRWYMWLKRKQFERASDELALLDMELDSWNKVICHSDELTDECLAEERSNAMDDYKFAIDDLDKTFQETAREKQKVNEVKRELAMVGHTDKLRLEAPTSEKFEATMRFFKSRGVSGVPDYTIVTRGKDLYEKISVPGPKGGTVPNKKSPPSPIETLIGVDAPQHPFTYALLAIRRLLETSLATVGITPHRTMAHKMYLKQERNDYTGGMPVVNLDKGDVICSQSQHTGNDSRSFLRWGTSNRASITSASVCSSNISTQQHHASSSDWGFLEVEISKLSIKQISLIVGAMKHLIVVYDACQAHRNDIPNEVMEEFLLNSYLLVPFVSQEVQRAASEYVKEQRIIKMQAKKEAMEASRKIRQEAIYEKHLNNTAAIGGRHGPQDVIEIRGVKQYKLQGSIRSTKNISPPFVPLTRESDSKHEYFRRDDSAGPRPAFKRHVISTEGKTPFLGLKVKPKRYDANTEIVTVQAVTGPSEAAGLQEGDEILRVGGKVVTNLKGFNALLAREASKPGILLNILYDRNGKTIETTITVGER